MHFLHVSFCGQFFDKWPCWRHPKHKPLVLTKSTFSSDGFAVKVRQSDKTCPSFLQKEHFISLLSLSEANVRAAGALFLSLGGVTFSFSLSPFSLGGAIFNASNEVTGLLPQ